MPSEGSPSALECDVVKSSRAVKAGSHDISVFDFVLLDIMHNVIEGGLCGAPASKSVLIK